MIKDHNILFVYLGRKRKRVAILTSQSKSTKTNVREEGSFSKNLLCQDLDQFSNAKKKCHWMKNGKSQNLPLYSGKWEKWKIQSIFS